MRVIWLPVKRWDGTENRGGCFAFKQQDSAIQSQTLRAKARISGRAAFLTANVLALSIVSLLADFSTEMIQPILPLFLVGVLGASYGLVGLIFGSADSVVSIVKVFSGWYSDRLGRRKPLTVAGYAPTAFLKPLLYFVQSPLQVFAIWLSDRFGKGVRGAPRDALIASSVERGWGRHSDSIGPWTRLAR